MCSTLAEVRSPIVAPRTDWNPVLRAELAKPYWAELQQFVADERAQHQVYPAADEVFAALHLTPYAAVKVLILGQDPYHGPGQAHGLCFSVPPGVPLPPSLQNIFKELETDLGIDRPDHGCLEAWAQPGRAPAQHHAHRARARRRRRTRARAGRPSPTR